MSKVFEARAICFAVLGMLGRPEVKYSSCKMASLGQQDNPATCCLIELHQALQQLCVWCVAAVLFRQQQRPPYTKGFAICMLAFDFALP